MIYTVYIMQSKSTHCLYIGQTSDIEKRFKQHAENHVVSTKNRGPWSILKTIPLESRSEAVKLELKLKKMKNPARVQAFLAKHY